MIIALNKSNACKDLILKYQEKGYYRFDMQVIVKRYIDLVHFDTDFEICTSVYLKPLSQKILCTGVGFDEVKIRDGINPQRDEDVNGVVSSSALFAAIVFMDDAGYHEYSANKMPRLSTPSQVVTGLLRFHGYETKDTWRYFHHKEQTYEVQLIVSNVLAQSDDIFASESVTAPSYIKIISDTMDSKVKLIERECSIYVIDGVVKAVWCKKYSPYMLPQPSMDPSIRSMLGDDLDIISIE